MRLLFENNPALLTLSEYVKVKSAAVKAQLHQRQMLKSGPIFPTEPLSETQNKFQATRAAKTIQRVWRERKIKESIMKTPYLSYLSLLDPREEQRLLSTVMFERHVAEFRSISKKRTKNPFINENTLYHRVDKQSGLLFAALLKDFNISSSNRAAHLYIPISLLASAPIEEFIKRHFPPSSSPVRIIKDARHSIGLLAIPHTNVNQKFLERMVQSAGFVATAWEIAENIKLSELPAIHVDRTPLHPGLPKTKETLLKSAISGKLNLIASSTRHPTHKLAKCLMKLLAELPSLTPQAVQRIALMLDMTNTFYEHNYGRFAFCVYAIIHEVSLALTKEETPQVLEKRYADFLNNAELTLLTTLGLTKESLTNSHFIALPALSGANAYTIAMRIAEKMRTETGETPKVKVVDPYYYEFGYITNNTILSNDADIFVLSCGPMVDSSGRVTPGIDINLFVKSHIIDERRTKPITIVIDATSALYKNIRLDPEVAALVEAGKLSIIIHESHQKFGLLHTDQAQYGRTFGLCAKGNYAEAVLREAQENSKKDFKRHVDMRIGAHISSTCGEILEEIKQQHFTNGALLRTLLAATPLLERERITSEETLANLDELYFLTGKKSEMATAIADAAEARESFGHYSLTAAAYSGHLRLSADASDVIDSLIQAAQIYLQSHYNPLQLLKLMKEYAKATEPFTFEQQVIGLAILNSVIPKINSLPKYAKHPVKLFAAVDNILKNCTLLCGRSHYLEPSRYRISLRQHLIKTYQMKNPKDFFKFAAAESLHLSDEMLDNTMALGLLMEKGISPTEEEIELIKRTPNLVCFLLSSANLTKINYQALITYYFLDERGIIATDDEISLINKTPVLFAYFMEKRNISEMGYKAAIALASSLPECTDFLKLTEQENFCKAVLKIHNTNQEILTNLATSPKKQAYVQAHSLPYLISCYTALKTYSDKTHVNAADKNELLFSLEDARRRYCQDALSIDRSAASKTARIALMVVVNFISGLFTLGIANYSYYRMTGSAVFFSDTNSGTTLNTTHRHVTRDIEQHSETGDYETVSLRKSAD